ncbi:MAG: hypothetical protein J6K31_15040 [Parabacteroides sp.]|nr:hypothetical protein [Parabacteroides sp.]
MKKIILLSISILIGLFSCNSEDEWLNSFQTLDDEQYAFYVADALEAMNMPRPVGSYNYPCLPGMLAWKDLKSSEEMKRVLRIPKKILKKQSTQAVIQALWELPDFPMYYYLSSSTYLQNIVEQFFFNDETYQELTKRSDAGACLAERYYRMNITKTRHAFYNNSLQLLLSQHIFLDQLSSREKKQLAKEMMSRIEVIRKVLKAESEKPIMSELPIYFCLVRIMANSKYTPMLAWMEEDEDASNFENGGDTLFIETDSHFPAKILELSTNFINEK